MKTLFMMLIIAAFLCGFFGDAEADPKMAFYDFGTEQFSTVTNAATNTNAITDVAFTTIELDGTELFKARNGSGYIHDQSQDFTAAGGWQIVTNYLSAGAQNMGTLTSSNLTTISSGIYLLLAPYSVKSDKNNTTVLVHAYTNDTFADNAGGGVELPNLTKFGAFAIIARLNMASNVTIDLRADVNLDCELTFEHASATLMLIGP